MTKSVYVIGPHHNHFRHIRTGPPMILMPTDAEVPPLEDISSKYICETYRFGRQVISPPRVCACGKYDLKWER